MPSPEDILRMIKANAGKGKPQGSGPPIPIMPGGPPAEMSADEYRTRMCMSEVNAILKKYQCKLIPQIILDPVLGVRGGCAIDIIHPEDTAVPGAPRQPDPLPEAPAATDPDVEAEAQRSIEAMRQEIINKDGIPDQEA